VVGANAAFVAPESPQENGYCEIFTTLRATQIPIERWRRHYSTIKLHSALGYRPPTPKIIFPIDQKPTMR
jgi:transposase InsO family protein